MSDSSSKDDAGPLDAEKTHVVPPPTPPSPIHLVHENAGRLLAGMLGSAPGSWEQEGDVIGPYRLCEIIGEGGFGNVWHAEQTEVIKREVALKLIKPGMDSAQVLGRFNQERQALASLKHPNIATLLDAGVGPNGRPYFAMELVHGGPVTDWCRAADATLEERLRLFIQICQAVQHAHEKGILHRDIKPTNILVADINGQPVPKVIDFGVAKALNASSLEELTLLTQADQAVGTPLYMSPEQIQGGRELDARSDVYALGVLLYELLTGSIPFDTTSAAVRGVEGLKRLILDTVPERPSTRVRRRPGTQQRKPKKGFEASLSMLPADLDWITMRALEKDRARRYASAADFAADIQRHLDCQPVLARPPGVTYRTGRWIRRNRSILVPACVALALSAMAVLVFRHITTQAPGGPARPLISADVPKPTFTNSLGMKFIPVPGTKVLFCIHETRRQDYAVFAAAAPGLDDGWKRLELEGVPVSDKDDQPVVGVSWADARAFCAWLSKKEGRHYRLPTHAEWNTAVGLTNRTQDLSSFPWGVKYPPDEAAGNYADKAFHEAFPAPAWIFGSNDSFATTAPVMSFRPNRFGLYDLGGNAEEWCEDLLGPEKKTAARGGGFRSAGRQSLVSATRNFDAAALLDENGFRCVVDDTTPYREGQPHAVSDLEPPRFPTPLPAAEMARRTVTNSLGMKFVPVPGTDVLFCIHETRRQDYAAYAAAVPGRDTTWMRATHQGVPAGHEDNHPVVSVSWEDAQAFCEWLSQKDRMLYRLPSDLEWSLALGLVEERNLSGRASTKDSMAQYFLWAAQTGNLADKAFHEKISGKGTTQNVLHNDSFVTTSPVMSFEANPFGLYDMAGNAAEWCEDWYDVQKIARTTRGSCYTSSTDEIALRLPNRSSDPGASRREFCGFRVAVEASTAPVSSTEPTTAAAQPFRHEQSGFPAPLPEEEVTRRSITNSLGMKFVPVPGTNVLFCIHETRSRDYAVYAEAVAGVDDTWAHQRDGNPTQMSHAPVAYVNWDDAQAFCRWLSKKDGRLHRLPTDHEWSLAAGLEEEAHLANNPAGTEPLNTTLYPWGTHFPPGPQDGNYADKIYYTKATATVSAILHSGPESDGNASAAPIMWYRPNPFGLYDMGGNISEWCVVAPSPATRATEIQRGGHYNTLSGPQNLLSSHRVWVSRASRNGSDGFRVVVEPGTPVPDSAQPAVLPPQHSHFEQSEFPAPLPPAEVARRSVTNSLGMKFVPVPGTPVLFCIHETRNRDYAAYVAAVPGVDDAWSRMTPGGVPKDDLPVGNTSWDEAQAFCAWLSKKESRACRMPTDHEWSLAVGLEELEPLTFAKRGTEPLNTTLYPWGTHFPPDAMDGNYADKANYEKDFAQYANVEFSPNPDPFVQAAPVMSFRPNPFGLYDMGGNVGEWCDFPNGGRMKFRRGGTYSAVSSRYELLSSTRWWASTDARRSWLGFRIVIAPDDAPAAATVAATVPAFGSATTVQPAAPASHSGNRMSVHLESPPPWTAEQMAKDTVTNSLGMKFLPVPGTDVLFCIHETRQQDFAAYSAAVPGVNGDWKRNRGPFEDDHPVSFINLQEAQRFCAWLSRKEGKTYRLPTDHEWSLAVGLDEKAPLTHESLQAGPLNTTHYPWNGRFPPEAADGNYAGKEWLKSEARHHSKAQLSGCDDGFLVTSPVMSFWANRFGLYDMGGNLAELCVFPPDAEGKRTEVLRGAWFYTQTTPENLLSSCRAWPTSPTIRGGSHGFRVVLEVDTNPAEAAAIAPKSTQSEQPMPPTRELKAK